MSADASVSAITRVSESKGRLSPLPDRSDVPFKLGERWVGYYNCNQGRTDLVLIFEVIDGSGSGDGRMGSDEDSIDVDAIFEFHFDGNGNPGYAPSDGASRVRGTYDVKARRLRLKAGEWIDQPQNYKLITLVGTVSTDGTYSGTVEGPGCTTFWASSERDNGRLVPPPASRGPRSRPIPRSLPRPRP